MLQVSDQSQHNEFLSCGRPHILMITNHGVQEWNMDPGLPDTGGQVAFVNELSHVLAQFGFRVTIVNRGGYPHPATGEMRTGVDYYNSYERLLLLEDSCQEFVRKEDMDEQLPELAEFLKRFTDEEDTPIQLIISHYWDAAKLGVLYNRMLSSPIRHIWVPHSLGALKKRNMPPESWGKLRIDDSRVWIRIGKWLLAITLWTPPWL